MTDKIGTLYVVATPIGNLADITFRAIEVLRQVDRIIVEDTRHALILLNHYDIAKPLITLFDHNEQEKLAQVMSGLQQGENYALISDAGTPLISDPGFPLIREANRQSIKIIPIPGACAAIAALSVAGLPANKFIFEGFLPVKKAAKLTLLESLLDESRTVIFYEAPHRLMDTLTLMLEIFGEEKQLTVARELTKVYESIKRDSLKNIYQYYLTHPKEVKGEIVLLLSGITKISEDKVLTGEKVLTILMNELPAKQAVSLASKITGEPKNKLYKISLAKR